MKTSGLTSWQLDWAVAKSKGFKTYLDTNGLPYMHLDQVQLRAFNTSFFEEELTRSLPLVGFSSNWQVGGPILSEARISRTIDHSGLWVAYWSDGYTEGDAGKLCMQCDRSELVAGLRCFVALKLGNDVEVPK